MKVALSSVLLRKSETQRGKEEVLLDETHTPDVAPGVSKFSMSVYGANQTTNERLPVRMRREFLQRKS